MDVTADFMPPTIEWFALSPYIALLAGALVLLLVGSLTPRWPRGWYAIVAATTAGVAAVLVGLQFAALETEAARTLVKGTIAHDRFGLLAIIAVCFTVVMSAMTTSDAASHDSLDTRSKSASRDSLEPYALMLTAALGAAVMVSANDLLAVFLGIEILSLSLYVLAASDRRRTASQEAGLKYFILGGFASAFLLYGIALVYGKTGQTNFGGISTVLAAEVSLPRNDTMLLAGVALLLVGFGFKVSLVPFHSWTPDVYQGAPTHVTGLMASLGKVAAVVAFVRLFVVAFPSSADDWRPAMFVLAILTLVVGSVLAIVQTDVKRMLAYSSISHAGFMLVGLEAAGHIGSSSAAEGVSSTITYVVLYSVLALGSFAAVSAVAAASGAASSGATSQSTSLDAFRGVAKRQPVFALGFTVLLLAQAGVPLTSGFVAKFGVIRAAVSTESYVLAIVAMVSAVIAAYLYLRIMVSMWLAEPDSSASSATVLTLPMRVVLVASVVITLVLGILPSFVLNLGDSLTALAR
ncbi:MAG: NADH-quinone oxidoreductase subunit NuoN [Actinomycetota bacterium]